MNPPNWHFSVMASFYDVLGGMMNHRHTHSLMNLEPGMRVLDGGGGTGLHRTFHPDIDLDAWLVLDLNQHMMQEGMQKQRDCLFVRGSTLDIPIPDDSLDRVLIADALHHMPDPRRIFRESAHVLAPDGKLLVEEINPATFIGRAVEISEWLMWMKSRFYEPSELRSLLQDTGFTIEKLQHQQYLYTLSCSLP